MKILFKTNNSMVCDLNSDLIPSYSFLTLSNSRLEYPKFVNGSMTFELYRAGILHFFMDSIIGKNINLIFSCYKKVTK